MQRIGSRLHPSATDLSNFLACRHRTALDVAVALGDLPKPPVYEDPLLDILHQRGLDHERRYVESLRATGRSVRDLTDLSTTRDAHVAATTDAMREGIGVIVQGALADERWFGKPDILIRVDAPSALGEWSYEVTDTKLSRETKAGTIMQLGLYSEMLGLVQGLRPEYFHVVTPNPDAPRETYRLNDYAAYIRMVRANMLATVGQEWAAVADANYPEPVDHCHVCRWSQRCDARRRTDDHLSLVANITRLHRRELDARGVTTLTDLAGLSMPLVPKPKRGSIESFMRARDQAHLQLRSRSLAVPLFELRDTVDGASLMAAPPPDGGEIVKREGLCRLPEPSPGDVFLDLEGDPFAAEATDNAAGGREYLFGVVTIGPGGQPEYRSYWGFTEQEERTSFEHVMDFIAARRKEHPGLHVFHYAPYEPAAFKRLMGRYATREGELDDLLRGEVFVDLFGVIRQGMLVGTERYSIKNLEPLYAFERSVQLLDANRCLHAVEYALESGVPETIPSEVRDAVEGYNRDDCISTLRLRDWLEAVRADHLAKGWTIPRPVPREADTTREPSERELRVAELRAELLEGIPESRAERNGEQQARWLLAYMLDYHRREGKVTWWEYFRLRDLPEDDLEDEPQAIAGLELVERVLVKKNVKTGNPTGTVTDRYRYPPQEMEIERGQLWLREGVRFGEVVAVDRSQRTVDVSKGRDQADNHPPSVFSHTHVPTAAQEDSLYAIGRRVAQDGGVVMNPSSAHRVARSLLLALPPRLTTGEFGARPGENVLDYLKRAALALDHSVLPVQGPPGSGKTYCGAEMILTLVAAGKTVGVTGPSHKVIRNLLNAVRDAAARYGRKIAVAQKAETDAFAEDGSGITILKENRDVAKSIAAGSADVAGGTAWLWSAADMADSVDVLFVDEAGQMALANVVAMSPSAKSIVLLGDPQQLEQPKKGSHPEGVGISALEHMLAGHSTVPDERGVFLPETWRMCPAISSFTSELFYEGRLTSKDGLELQRLDGASDIEGSGFWIFSAEHDGNRTSSPEEIELVGRLVEHLTAAGSMWTDREGVAHQVAGGDILVVAPYNAQVSRLADRLRGTGVRVGTVDKFQGQEAPVVIYSMATSRPEDAPRGMEFLYSVNRLNVATSRARCAAVVVAAQRLFEPECRTARQMKLANALCRCGERGRDGRGGQAASWDPRPLENPVERSGG